MRRCILLGFVGLSLLGCSSCLDNLNRQGVKLHNEIDAKSENQMRNNGLIDVGEHPLAYYDTTLSLDGSESFLVTNLALKHYRHGQINEMSLMDIDSVEQQDAGLDGYRVIASSGQRKLILVFAPLNDGPLFLAELREQVAKAQGR